MVFPKRKTSGRRLFGSDRFVKNDMKYLFTTALILLSVPAINAQQAESAAPVTEKTEKPTEIRVPQQQNQFQKLFQEGREHYDAEEFAKAAQAFQRALKANPKSAEAFYYLGSCYYELSLYIEAVGAYGEAVKLKPDYYEAVVYLGNSLDYNGQFAEAVEMYKKAIQLKPNDWQPYFELGIAQYNQKKYSDAAVSFQNSIKRDAKIARTHYQLAESLRMIERFTEAVKAYQEAIKLETEYDMAYYGLGMAFIGQSNAIGARQQYDKLRVLNPNLAAQLLVEINKIQMAT